MYLIAIFLTFICLEWTSVYCIQPSILADLKQMEQDSASRIPNKVKRAQEVVMFGNQQNKLADNHYVRADKRDLPNIPVPDVQNNLDKDEIEEPVAMASIENPSYQQYAEIRPRYYYDRPDMYDLEVAYDDRQKRSIQKRSPAKKRDRIFRSSNGENNRIKRESHLSQLDTEDLLSILGMLEAEQRKKHPFERYGSRFGRPEYEPYSNEILNEVENDDESDNEEWLDGPVLPSHHYGVKPRFYPPYNNLIANRQVRRYKNNQDSEYARALSHLNGNGGKTDGQSLFHRRYLL